MGSSSPKATSRDPAVPPSSDVAQTSALLQALTESVRGETGGEVIVRTGARTGRLYFFHGRVAWVTASTLPLTLTDHLVAKGLANASDVAAVFAECRRKGGNFAEMLVAWQLIDRDRMRAEVLEHISRAFGHIVGWGEVATMFVPSSRVYKGSLTYSLAELVEATKAVAPEKSDLLDELLRGTAPASAPQVAEILARLDEGLRTAVVEQLRELRNTTGCRSVCFAGDGVSCTDTVEPPTSIGGDSCASTAAMLRAASAASAQAGFGACGEVTLVGLTGALMAWRVTCEGSGGGGLLMLILDVDTSLPLTRLVLERALSAGPLRQAPPEAGS